jgi:asparagine synthase (glutamine-hydrolysing)
LKELLVEYLSPERLQREGFLNVAATQKLLHEYLGGRVVRIDRLWFPLMFEMWHERWMGR